MRTVGHKLFSVKAFRHKYRLYALIMNSGETFCNILKLMAEFLNEISLTTLLVWTANGKFRKKIK